jgi:predicted lipid-binding transport protein (Tim44 family)
MARANNVSRSVVEIAGLILGMLLIGSMLFDMSIMAKIALVAFAVIGVIAVFQELTQKNGGAMRPAPPLPPMPQQPQPGYQYDPTVQPQPQMQAQVQPQAYTQQWPQPSVYQAPAKKPKSLITKLGITLVIIATGVFILPAVGFGCLILLIMVTTGGQGS